ncbi:MAG TPA: cation:proton antiporter [Rhodocyclaceae bacterium]|nr:cation:proton antiporter [Rhodocyclaceae bacterium]
MSSHTLQLALVLLGAAVFMVVLFRHLNLPSILGYLLVGIVVGPHALNVGADSIGARHLAEFGVVFLMFSIGLEFSLARLYRMKRLVFGLGLAQVLGSMLLASTLVWMVGLPWHSGFALGGALSMSSTAVLSKLLAERLELESTHGREVMGVLLFQDLAVVPLLILVPALSSPASELAEKLMWAGFKAAIVLTVVVFLGQRLMRAWFFIVARTKSAELFVLNVLLITLGLAFVTELAGLSLALGAFLAGMLISETEYRYQVEDDIKPFRDVLLGLFFITIGTYLDLRVVAENLFWVIGFLLLLLGGKLAVTWSLSRFLGASSGTALRTGLWLCAGGEFGFVLMAQLSESELLAPNQLQIVLAGLVLSLLLAPIIVHFSDRIVMRFVAAEWLARSMQLTSLAAQTLEATKHVIVCGYGRTGQHLVRFMENEDVTIVALDNDPERVRSASQRGEPAVFGDCSRRETLMAAGIMRADVLVVTFADTHVSMKILHLAHELRPELPVVVRTAEEADVDKLVAAGAAEVVPEALESGIMLSTHALALLGVPMSRVIKRLRTTREQYYTTFRGAFSGTSYDDGPAMPEADQARLHAVHLPVGAHVLGKCMADVELAATGAGLSAVRRLGGKGIVGLDEPLQIGDTVLLMGSESAVIAAESLLLTGK